MARKLKPHEERAFLEASSPTGSAFSGEKCQTCQLRTAMDHSLFDNHSPTLAHVELLVDGELGQDDWF